LENTDSLLDFSGLPAFPAEPLPAAWSAGIAPKSTKNPMKSAQKVKK
jgi:hypothetical protein